jgi:DHA3 family macrolide efflux protein-like MFS transporter
MALDSVEGGSSSAYKSVLKNKIFLTYFLATSISDLGNFAALTGFLFVVYDLTHSRTQTTGVGLAETVPYLLFGLVGGAVADRTRKARTNAIADGARGVVELGVLVWYATSGLPVAGAYIAVVAIQLGGCVANPSRRALVPDLVTANELTAANALVGNSNYAVSILGPVVATGLLAVGGLGAFFGFDAATYLVSAISMCLLTRWLHEEDTVRGPGRSLRKQLGSAAVRSMARDFADLGQAVRKRRDLLALFCLSGLVILFYTWPWQIGIVIKASSIGGNGARNYTVIMAVFAAAVILAGLGIAWIFKKLGIGHYLAATVVWGLGLAGIGLVRGEIAILIMAALMGLGLSGTLQVRLYMLQTSVPPGMIGRAYSVYSLIAYGANVGGLVIVGFITGAGAALDVVFVLSGAALIAIGVLGMGGWLVVRARRQAAPE